MIMGPMRTDSTNLTPPSPTRTDRWRLAVLLTLVFGSLLALLGLDPIPQDIAYHAFADTRPFFGIPNGFDVLSNLPFLAVGFLGLRCCMRRQADAVRRAWIVLFAGVTLVSAGSAYYHWHPNNDTLVWDRLPMTIGFMGLFVALLGEYVDRRAVRYLLVPAVLVGVTSVGYWHWTDDLRPYVWVQFMPLLVVPALLILYQSGYSHQWLLLVALGWYLLAKAAEFYDPDIFRITQGLISGHTIKHLLAAAGSYSMVVMLQNRKVRR